jgi:hypothetical protein
MTRLCYKLAPAQDRCALEQLSQPISAIVYLYNGSGLTTVTQSPTQETLPLHIQLTIVFNVLLFEMVFKFGFPNCGLGRLLAYKLINKPKDQMRLVRPV